MSPRIRLLALAVLAGLAPLASQAADAKASRFYEDALKRYEKRDITGAIVQLKNALQIDAGLLPVHLLLGQALLTDGQVIASEVAFQEALRLGVDRAEVVLALASDYIALGKQRALLDQPVFKPEGLRADVRVPLLLLRASAAGDLGDARLAMLSIDEARSIDPMSASVWLAEVRLRIRSREFAKATEAADRALALAPKSAEALYQKASIAHVQGDVAAAVAGYDRALVLDPAHVESRVARCGLLLDLGRAADANKDSAELRRLAPREPRGAYLRSLIAERDGNATAAAAELRDVVGLLDPVPPEFLQYRPQLLMLAGLAHYGLNEPEKAAPFFEQLQRVSGPSPATKLLAQIYLAGPDADRAVGLLTSYLAARPGDTQAMTLLASTYLANGRNAQAASLMQEALRTRDVPESRTMLGLSLLGADRAREAATELENAFKRDPKQTRAGAALVGIYLRGGQNAQALAIAETLARQTPPNPVLVNLLGLAQVQAGNAAGARVAFEQAVKLDPGMFPARLNLARIDIAAKAYDAAAAQLGEVLKLAPKHTEAMVQMASLSLVVGKPAEAKRWLDKAADAAGPRDTAPGLALIDFHLRRGENALALDAAKRLAAAAPADVQALLASARAQLANADTRGARASLGAATTAAGFDPTTQVRIAGLQLLTDNLPGAAYSLEKALSAQPDFLPAQALNVDLQLRKGDIARAEQQARQIVQAHPDRAIGYSLLGDVAVARRQTAAALDAFRRAHQAEPSSDSVVRLIRASSSVDTDVATARDSLAWLKTHPRDLRARAELGDAYARSGNFIAARQHYEALLKIAPDDAAALNNLANVQLRAKDPQALATAEKALSRDPSNAAVIDTAGWAAYRAGQSDRALQLLRDARLRDPSRPEIRYHLATVLAHADRRTEALEELEAALRSGQRLDEDRAAVDALAHSLRAQTK